MINEVADTEHLVDLHEQICHPSLGRLYQYWNERKGIRRWPSRRDMDPLDFPYILGKVMLLDVLHDPLRFRVRLHGSDMTARSGYDLTGKSLEALPIADYRSYLIERCRGIVQSGRPLVVRHSRIIGSELQRYEALWLPLSDNDADTTILMCALVYQGDRS